MNGWIRSFLHTVAMGVSGAVAASEGSRNVEVKAACRYRSRTRDSVSAHRVWA
jgi:hypothetical protein